MTIRERLHHWIDTLPETELSKVAHHYGVDEEHNALSETEQTIALWEAFAKPMSDSDAVVEFSKAVERRPFFGDREYPVNPD